MGYYVFIHVHCLIRCIDFVPFGVGYDEYRDVIVVFFGLQVWPSVMLVLLVPMLAGVLCLCVSI